MKILITGSMGFIGTHLMDSLKSKGHKVLGMDKKVGSDISEIGKTHSTIDTLLGEPDFIVNLASDCSSIKGETNPRETFKDNVVGVFSLLEYIRIHPNTKLIHISTCKVYPGDDGLQTPYGATKEMGETLIYSYADTYGVEYVINRPGTIYGPGQQGSTESGWVGWFLKANVEDLPVTIYGDGKQMRDMLFIDDFIYLLVNQILNFEKYKNQTFDVGGGPNNAIEIKELLDYLGHEQVSFAPIRKGDAKAYISNNKIISKVNNWKPETYWKHGINVTMDSLREQK